MQSETLPLLRPRPEIISEWHHILLCHYTKAVLEGRSNRFMYCLLNQARREIVLMRKQRKGQRQ